MNPKELNPLEVAQQETNRMIFIKSYPMINNITSINPMQKQLIELILSYQFDDKQFFMQYEDVGKILKIETQTVTNYVSKLKKLGYIKSSNQSNFDGDAGGSTSTLFVNVSKLIADAKLSPTSTERNKSIPKPVEEIKQLQPVEKIDLDEPDDAITLGAGSVESALEDEDAPIDFDYILENEDDDFYQAKRQPLEFFEVRDRMNGERYKIDNRFKAMWDKWGDGHKNKLLHNTSQVFLNIKLIEAYREKHKTYN